jgi:hypothetical protein
VWPLVTAYSIEPPFPAPPLQGSFRNTGPRGRPVVADPTRRTLTMRCVSAWRRKAIEMFPEWRQELEDGEEFSPYAVWFEVLPRAREAHREGDTELLRRIYGYAEWSLRQSGELRNAAGVTFYEHLFDEPWMRPLVVPWLSRSVIEEVRQLWEARLAPAEMREVEKLIKTAR